MVKPKIIAEIASCHNGDLELAKAMIRSAAECGVDIVKFQSWQAKNINPNDPDYKRYQKLELSDDAHYVLINECEKNNVEFLTSIFDINRVDFLKSLGLKRIKISSNDTRHPKLLNAVKPYFNHILASTGMTHPEEVKQAIETLKGSNFTLLHCVSIYPTPFEKANLDKILWLKSLHSSIGYSDHTQGSEASIVAMSMGAEFIEKHFTLSRHLPQETHATSDISKPITTHSIADEPFVFKQICEWAEKIAKLKGEGRLEVLEEELRVRSKYDGRLGDNK